MKPAHPCKTAVNVNALSRPYGTPLHRSMLLALLTNLDLANGRRCRSKCQDHGELTPLMYTLRILPVPWLFFPNCLPRSVIYNSVWSPSTKPGVARLRPNCALLTADGSSTNSCSSSGVVYHSTLQEKHDAPYLYKACSRQVNACYRSSRA
jgi:hypothetical protein